MNRRQFIRDSALAGGATAAGRPFTAVGGERSRPEIADSPLPGSGAAPPCSATKAARAAAVAQAPVVQPRRKGLSKDLSAATSLMGLL